MILLDLPSFSMKDMLKRNFPKRCSCGHAYTYRQWLLLPLLGRVEYDWGEVQEMRNCICGSTLAISLIEGEPE
jgi:hypothetical protein